MTTPSSKRTFVLYARKSSENDERQALSIPDQIREMKKIQRLDDLEVAEIIKEAHSAKDSGKRPRFNEMVKGIRAGKYNAILSWSNDRLARNAGDLGTLVDLFDQGHLKQIRTQSHTFTNEPNDKFLLMILGSQAKLENDHRSKNIRRGLATKLRHGVWPSVAPPGYRNTKYQEHGTNEILVDEKRFPILREAWERLLSRAYSPMEILDFINNKKGFRTRKSKKLGGRPLSRSALYRMFSNPFYAGTFVYNGKEYQGKHKPMVTWQEFEEAQRILGRPSPPRPWANSYFFVGQLQCGECGGHISATIVGRKRKTLGLTRIYVLYYCVAARTGRRPCNQRRYINENCIVEQVSSRVAQIYLPDPLIQLVLIIAREEFEKAASSEMSAQKARNKAQAALERQRENLRRMRLQDQIDDEEYEVERGRIERELSGLTAGSRNEETSPRRMLEEIEDHLVLLGQAAEVLKSGRPKELQQVLAGICTGGTLKDQKVALQLHKWVKAFEQCPPQVCREIKVFERLYGPSVESWKTISRPLRSFVRRVADEVANGPESNSI